MTRNHTHMIGPKAEPTLAVPCAWTMKIRVRMTSVSGMM